jgi:hypothetical protein
MLNLYRLSWVSSGLLCVAMCLPGSAARGQAVPVSGLSRQLSRVDLAVSGVGQFTGGVSGTNYLNQPLTQDASNTLGALVTLRYIKSPLIGFEGNYGYARYTENFSAYVIGGAQTKASEYTLGYVAHLPTFVGLQPYVSAGAGSIAFRPTPNGGQGLPVQARAAYYYSAGVENTVFSSHFGIRAQVRQVFFKAPDFGQNYLTINKRTSTFEPGIGIFLRF